MIYWIQWNWRLEHRLADPPKSKCPKVFFIPSFLMVFFQTHKSHSLSRQPSNSPSPPPSLGDFHPQTAWQTLLALSTQDGFRQEKKKKKEEENKVTCLYPIAFCTITPEIKGGGRYQPSEKASLSRRALRVTRHRQNLPEAEPTHHPSPHPTKWNTVTLFPERHCHTEGGTH